MIPIFDLHNFFDGLPGDVKADFDRVSHYRNVDEGCMLVRTGDKRGTVLQLVEGKVHYFSCDSRGRETLVATMKRGDWIGLSEVFSGTPASADVVTTTKARLRNISKPDFEGLVDRHPIIARQLLRLFTLRFNVIYRAVQDQHELSLRERLLKTLYVLSLGQFCVEEPEGTLSIGISQEELAKILAASRQTLNRILRELEREGVIKLGYRWIRLMDQEQLAATYGHLFGIGELAPI